MTAPSWLNETVDFGSVGHLLQSEVEFHFSYWAMVLRLVPSRIASCLKLS
jgi:uncharacterized protein (DUF983 family)